ALPALGLGVAVKCSDGAARAAEVVTATVVTRLIGRTDDPVFERFLRPEIRDWNGVVVGGLRSSAGWADGLSARPERDAAGSLLQVDAGGTSG
ncbi:MAG: asparaginase, partial [Siculibacillus sp.]|nr:asparaginase [Siculibacillus sp.]